MIHFLWVGIPGLLFEPIAVVSLLGIITSLIVFRKKHDRFYWICIVSFVFVFSWRLGFHSLMVTSRYISILLYPASILVAWVCFYLVPWIVDRFSFLNKKTTEKLNSVIPFVIVFGLAIACLVKTLHYNPYGDHVAKISAKITEDAGKNVAGKDFFIITGAESERIAYYSKTNIQNIISVKDKDDNSSDNPELFKKTIESLSNRFEYFYCVFFERKGELEPISEYFHRNPQYGYFECLHREYTSRRKNKEIVLFRFTPAHPNIDIWDKPLPELPKDTLIQNGDFETALTGEPWEKLREKYAQQELTLYVDMNRKIPADWRLDLGTWCKEHIPDMSLVSERALAGQYSLSLAPSHPYYAASVFSSHIQKRNNDFQYSFFVRNDGTERIELQVRTFSWIPEENRIRLGYDKFFTLNPGMPCRIHDTITVEDVYLDAASFYFCISATKGKVILDNFSVTNGIVQEH